MNYDDFYAKEEDFLRRHNNVYISDKQYEILLKYNINVDNYKNINTLLYDIEEILNSGSDFEDLEWVSQTLSEYNYYNNTNK